MTVNATLSTLTHHGIIFVPLGYKNVFPLLTNLSEVHGGMLSPLELVINTRLTLHFPRISVGCRYLRWC